MSRNENKNMEDSESLGVKKHASSETIKQEGSEIQQKLQFLQNMTQSDVIKRCILKHVGCKMDCR